MNTGIINVSDGFLYARCAVLANGKDFYDKILNQPDLMPQEISFEPILYLAEHAYRLKTGKDDYDYLPGICYETFGNEKGWPTLTPSPTFQNHLRTQHLPKVFFFFFAL